MLNHWFTACRIGIISVMLSFVAQADQAAEQLLKGARYAATLQNQDLHGFMKKNGNAHPITLFLRGKDIQFLYKAGNEDKRFHLQLMDNQFDLIEIIADKQKKFDDAMLAKKINDTDLSYEDLAMRFLYWKDSKIVGAEKIGGQMCHKVRLLNPGKAGDYKIVYVWIHQKHGALMRVVGYNMEGIPLKQFQVTDIMKVGKEYTLKRMRVDSLVAGKITGTTYLEFEKPKKAAGVQPGR